MGGKKASLSSSPMVRGRVIIIYIFALATARPMIPLFDYYGQSGQTLVFGQIVAGCDKKLTKRS